MSLTEYQRGYLAGVTDSAKECDDVIVHQTGEDAVESVELAWSGTDAGEHPDRHLEIRRRKVVYAERVGEWKEWERA